MKFEIKDITIDELTIILTALGPTMSKVKGFPIIDETAYKLPTYPVEELTDDEVLAIVSGEPMQEPAHDSDGSYWDAEIHSSSKAMNKDGTWKKKKVFNKTELPDVKLRTATSDDHLSPNPIIDEAIVASVPPPPPAPVESAVAMSYADFVKQVSEKLSKGKTMSDVSTIIHSLGYASIGDLRAKPELFEAVLFELDI